MTASTIKEQLSQPYVGNLVYLFHLDMTPLGVSTQLYFTPSSSSVINFNGQAYTPMPVELTGISNNMVSAPGRATLRLGANTDGTYSRMLVSLVISLGDLVGARINVTKTFENFLDGKPQGGTDQSFLTERFIIYRKDSFGPEGISWTVTSELDRPYVLLPLRQTLKSDVGTGALYAPGMQRLRL